MKRVLVWIFDFLFNTFLILMLVINLLSIFERNVLKNPLPQLGGLGYAIIVSGSMAPEIMVNDVVYIMESSSYYVGDVVTYVYEEKGEQYLITHRIVKKTIDGRFILQGDANNSPDTDPVLESQIKGKVIYVAPGIGATVTFMRTPLGTLILILLSLLLIEFPHLVRLRKRRSSEKQMAETMARLRRVAAVTTPDMVVEESPEEILVETGKSAPTNKFKDRLDELNKEKKYDVPSYMLKEEKPKLSIKDLFRRKPKIYIPDEGVWSID